MIYELCLGTDTGGWTVPLQRATGWIHLHRAGAPGLLCGPTALNLCWLCGAMRHPKHHNLQGLQGWTSDCPWNELRCPRLSTPRGPELSWRFQQCREGRACEHRHGATGAIWQCLMAPCLANNPVWHQLLGHSQLQVLHACVQDQPLTGIQELFSLSIHTDTFQKLTGAWLQKNDLIWFERMANCFQ